MRGRDVLFGLAVGLGLGLVTGEVLRGRVPPVEVPPAETPADAPGRGACAAPPSEPRPEPVLTASPPTPAAAQVASPALEARVAAKAEELRAHAKRMLEETESMARRHVAVEVERERAAAQRAQVEAARVQAEREAAERRGPPGLVAALAHAGHADGQWALVGDPAAFGRLFERRTDGVRIDGHRLRPEDALGEGDRIAFPPGRHLLDVRSWQGRPFPADVVIEGQHMDQTLVVLNDELRMSGDVRSLTFRDLTIHCGDHYLEALRGGAYTLRLERCRVVGFDMGAGGSSMLSGGTGAFYATQSRIEAGFGRSPGSGNLFDVRGGLFARLEDCDLVGPFRSLWQSGRATHVFERCRFQDMPAGFREASESPPDEVRLERCTWTFLAEDARRPKAPRDVAEINPAWAEPRR